MRIFNFKDPSSCLKAFKSNNMFGLIMLLNIIIVKKFIMTKSKIFRRLYKDYSKKYLSKIILSGVFAILVAASTSSIAWLLDPAIKKLFIEKDQSLLVLIPTLIIVAFCV